MYYYAELNSDYLVIAKHALAEESDNANYFAITEDQYNEDIVGKYCNKTTGTFYYFEIGDSMGTIEWIEYHKAPNMPFSIKFDNYEMETQAELDGKADIAHTHSEYALTTHIHDYASANDISALQTAMDDKADIGHTHSEYSETTHHHNDAYSPLSHSHTASEIGAADSGHNHDDDYAAIDHAHIDYVTTTALDELSTTVSGKANASHTHTIANITNLQSTLDGKAAASHGTHVSYSATAPVMDGTASVGTASTVARSDHKHPTDTSRASASDLTSHTSNKSNPHGVTLAQLSITATATELNYMDGVTSNVQTQLNSKAASSHNHSGIYANASHTHTASAVGAVATSDVATLSEVETYLGI